MKARIQRRRSDESRVPAAQAIAGRREAGPVQAQLPSTQRLEDVRAKAKPADGALKDLLRSYISDKPGSCQACAVAVYQCLATIVDGEAGQNLGAQLLTWAENAGARDGHSRQHTAATATWEGVTYVIDTSAAQFGGPELFIGSVAAWQQTVLNLVQDKEHRVSDPQLDRLATPFSESAMRHIQAQHEKKHPQHAVHLMFETQAGAMGSGGKP